MAINPLALAATGAQLGAQAMPRRIPPEGTVPMHQSAWRTGPAGPVDTGGKGIYMYGSAQPKPQPLAPWMQNYYKQKRLADMQRRSQIFHPAEVRNILRSNPTAETLKALEAAKRYESQMNFANAVKAGMPIPQAMAQYGGEMQGNKMLMQMYQQAAQRSQPPRVVDLPGGKGRAMWTGRGWSQLYDRPATQPKPAMSMSNRISVGNWKIRDIDSRLDKLRAQQALKADPAIQQQITSLEGERQSIIGSIEGAGAGQAKRVETREQYDDLPSGTVYIGKDGNQYRKP